MMATDGVVIVADDRWAVRSRVRTWLGSCSRWRRRLSTTTAPCPLAGTRHVLRFIEMALGGNAPRLRACGAVGSRARIRWPRPRGQCRDTVTSSQARLKLEREQREVELAGRASAADRTVSFIATGRFNQTTTTQGRNHSSIKMTSGASLQHPTASTYTRNKCLKRSRASAVDTSSSTRRFLKRFRLSMRLRFVADEQ